MSFSEMLFELLKYFMENLAPAFEDKKPGFSKKKKVKPPVNKNNFPSKGQFLLPGVGELGWNVGWSTPVLH